MRRAEELLLELLGVQSVSGNERNLAATLERYFSRTTDGTLRDALGSLIFRKSGAPGARRIMLAAHADEVGLMVTDILDGGFLRVTGIGGARAASLAAQELSIYGRETVTGVVCVKPPHLIENDDAKRMGRIDGLYVDTGFTRAQLLEKVSVGDTAVVKSEPVRLLGRRIAARGLDDKCGLALMYDVSERLLKLGTELELYYAATAQEEVGLRGAATSAEIVAPDAAVILDVTYAAQPGCDAPQPARLGGGPSIVVGSRTSRRLVRRFCEVCDEYRIKFQRELSPSASYTDADAIQVSQLGVPCLIISVPLRNMHSCTEVADLAELEAIGQAAALFIRSLEGFEWEYGKCI